LQAGIVIEYFGVRGDPDYRIRTAHKLNVYRKNKIEVIALFPRDYFKKNWKERQIQRIDQKLRRHLQLLHLKTNPESLKS